MTMFKLSEKGFGKLYNSKACYYDPDTEEEVVALSYFEHVFEFEPDDFQGVVCLTVEEAKDLYGLCFNLYHNKWKLPGFDLEEALNFLEERIEQAEGKDE